MLNFKFVRKTIYSIFNLFALFQLSVSIAFSNNDSIDSLEEKSDNKTEEVENLPDKIEDLENYFRKFKLISASVVRLKDGKNLVKRNDTLKLNPASAIKILTASAALYQLGTDFRFKTKIYCNSDGFYILGGADPSLVSEQIYLLAKNFSNILKNNLPNQCKNTPRILNIDTSLFDDQSIPENRKDIRTNRAYNSRISAINLNYNALTVKIDEHSNIFTEYSSPYIKLIKNKPKNLKFPQITKSENTKEVILSITLPKKMKSSTVKYFNIENPELFFGNSFNQELSQHFNGKYFFNKIQKKTLGNQSTLLYEHESIPLHQIVYLMNKYSNNMIADVLTKYLASTQKNSAAPFNETQGLEALKEEYQRLTGMTLDNLYSGSGLTDKNKLSAYEFIKLLEGLSKQKAYLPELLTSLPISGVDGTLRKLSKQGIENKNLRAKTGTLDDSQALVGFSDHSTHGLIAFAVIVNGNQRFDSAKLASLLLGN